MTEFVNEDFYIYIYQMKSIIYIFTYNNRIFIALFYYVTN